MLNSDIKLPSYMSDGPAYPGETVHTAMGENTAYALTSHMFGHSLEHEPVDHAERAAQHTCGAAARRRQLGQAKSLHPEPRGCLGQRASICARRIAVDLLPGTCSTSSPRSWPARRWSSTCRPSRSRPGLIAS